MNWKARVSLILVFTMLFSTFMYQGWFAPKHAEAAVALLDTAWSTETSGTGSQTAHTYTAPAGSDRVVIVFIAGESGGISASGVTVGGAGNPAQLIGQVNGGNSYVSAWYRVIGTSSSTTSANIAVTWSTAPTTDTTITAATYGGVLQAQNGTFGASNAVNSAGTASRNNAGALSVNNIASLTDGRVLVHINENGGTQIDVAGTTSTGRTFIQPWWHVASSNSNAVHQGAVETTNVTANVNHTVVGNRGSMVAYALNPTASDTTRPNVTINQAAGQPDPTGTAPINFTVVFSETVINFATGDVQITGTAGGSKTAVVTGSGTTYNVAVSGMTTSGTVIASIVADVANDPAGNGNNASTSTDNTVTWDKTPPTTTDNASSTWTATSPVTVNLSATDSGGGTVANTYWCVDTTGTTCNPATGSTGTSVNVTCTAGTVCQQYVRSYSVDNFGNTESVKTSSVVRQDRQAPNTVTLNTPADEAIDQPLNVSLTCNATTDPSPGSGSVEYQFNVIDTGTYNQNSAWSTSLSYSPPSLANGTTYTWKVKARDAVGNETAWSTPRSFTTIQQCFRNDPALNFVGPTISTITTDAGTANYTLEVKNNDIGGCPDSTFNLSAAEVLDEFDHYVQPPTVVPGSVTLAPGASQNVTLGVTARSGETTGRTTSTVTSAANTGHNAVMSAPTTTNLNVSTCTPNAPQLAIGPDAANVTKGGSLTYNISLKNADVGAACTQVTYTVSIDAQDPSVPNADFNASTLTYGAQVSQPSVTVALNPGQTVTITLTVSSKSGATLDAVDATTVGVTAAGHASPADVTATTTVGNRMIHNSINTGSTKWSGSGGWGVPGGKYGEFICDTCHTLGTQSTTNIKKVRGSITTPDSSQGLLPGDLHATPIVFTRVVGNPGDSGTLGDDSNAPRTASNKVCENCHTYDASGANGVKVHAHDQVAYTTDTDGKSVSSNHKNFNAGDCILCHAHNKGFLPSDCSGCHGEPPSSVGTLVTLPTDRITGSTLPGAHVKHVTDFSFDCTVCHSGYLMPEESTVLPGQGNISIGFNVLGATTGSYSGQTGVSYSVNGGAHFQGDGTKNCSSVYCHSVGNLSDATGSGSIVAIDGTSYRTVAWDGTALDCTSCHGNQTDKAHPTNTGTAGSTTANSHVKHIEGSGINCSNCHYGTTLSTTIPPTTIITGGAHLNRVESVQFKAISGKTGTYDPTVTTGKTCSNTYCHGTGPSVQWGGSTTCVSCHGATSNGELSVNVSVGHAKHYGSTSAPTAINSTNAHSVSTYVYGCGNCHPSATHAQGPADATGPVLQDAQIGGTKLPSGNYAQGTSSTTDTKGYNYTTNGTCSTVCHTRDGATLGSGITASPAWNGTNSLGCGFCHNKAGDSSPTWSAPHTKHINTYSANTNITCEACHTGTAASNSALQATSAARNQHPDTNKNVAFGTFAGGQWSGTQCSNTYCHSKGTTLTSPYSHSAISWSGSMTCTSCHGGEGGSTTGAPNYANTSPKANSHAAHTSTCSACHNDTTTTSTTITGFDKHVNKTYDIAAGAGVSIGGYNTGTKQCSNISCHGNNNATWGGGSLGCGGCHLALPTTGAHGIHVQTGASSYGQTTVNSTAGAYDFGCGNCHPKSAGTHGNGSVDIVLNDGGGGIDDPLKDKNPAGAGRTGTGTSTVCNNIYCHSSGSASPTYAATPTWGGTFSGDKCAGCHGNTPSTGNHPNHVMAGIHFNELFNGDTGLNTTMANSATAAHGSAATSTTISCNICHYDTVAVKYNSKNSGCGTASCHNGRTGNSSIGDEAAVIASRITHVNGIADIKMATLTDSLRSKAQLRDENFSQVNGMARQTGYKVSGAFDQGSLAVGNYDSGTGNCTVACHMSNAVKWTDSVNCLSCHSSLP